MEQIMTYENYVELQTNVYDIEIYKADNPEYDILVKNWIEQESTSQHEYFFGDMDEEELADYDCSNDHVTSTPVESDCTDCTETCGFRDSLEEQAHVALEKYEYTDVFMVGNEEVDLKKIYDYQLTIANKILLEFG